MTIHQFWARRSIGTFLLWPLSWLFSGIARCRRAYLQSKQTPFKAKVVVIGNINVGGVGKTPLLMAWVNQLQQAGQKVGVVSRGYGGAHQGKTLLVDAESSVSEAGDEPVLIATKTQVPVAVNADRVQAVKDLLAVHKLDVVLSDDGLQHYRMHRDVEVVVLDATQGIGNGFCLPAGPLREPVSRLASVDKILVKGEKGEAVPGVPDRYLKQAEYFQVSPGKLKNLKTGKMVSVSHFKNKQVHALAGIGQPEVFFVQCEAAGMTVQRHPFADHYDYQPSDLAFGDGLPIIMTEKDAVKVRGFATEAMWAWGLEVSLPKGAFIT